MKIESLGIDLAENICSVAGLDNTGCIEAILAGRQPPELTARRLRSLRPIPPNWADQRELLGFDSIT